VLYVDDNLPPIGSLPSRDVVSLLWEYGSIATQLDAVAFDLDDPTTTALSSDALPFASLDLDAFASRGGAYTRFRNYQAVGQFSFTIESMAVPEPSVAVFLAASGAAGAAARARRRSHAQGLRRFTAISRSSSKICTLSVPCFALGLCPDLRPLGRP
jgi:hypothetical protein